MLTEQQRQKLNKNQKHFGEEYSKSREKGIEERACSRKRLGSERWGDPQLDRKKGSTRGECVERSKGEKEREATKESDRKL